MSIDELVNIHYDNLNQNDLYIWKYIHSNKKQCCSLTIEELASKCNVSRTTILRFAQKLSLKGYSELKVYLNWDVSKAKENEGIHIDSAFDSYEKAISDLRKKDFTEVCKLIHDSNRVFIYGTGQIQKSIAEELKRIFLNAEKYFYIIGGPNEMNIILNTIKPDDLVIFISMNGESDEVTGFAKVLKVINIPTVSMTRLTENKLARLCNENIYTNTANINLNYGYSYETTTIFFVLIEILFLKYCTIYPR